jgi:hypothetical protein
MARIPYWGRDDDPISNSPWLNLKEIADSLENGEKIRPNLAKWLSSAIRHAEHDHKKLLRYLGLTFSQGGQNEIPNWYLYAERLCQLEHEGTEPEQALSIVMAEMNDSVTRSTLQRWKKNYQRIIEEPWQN